jgi:hypothetical protein
MLRRRYCSRLAVALFCEVLFALEAKMHVPRYQGRPIGLSLRRMYLISVRTRGVGWACARRAVSGASSVSVLGPPVKVPLFFWRRVRLPLWHTESILGRCSDVPYLL